jgi:hypothetical protein
LRMGIASDKIRNPSNLPKCRVDVCINSFENH